MEPTLNGELQRLRSDVERLSLEAQRKEREVALLTGVICRLETELVRNSNTTPAQATIGGANLRDLLQLSPPDLLDLDDDIRLMRRKVLDRAPTGYAEDVQEYLTKAMKEAMIRRGVRYDDGANCDWKGPWLKVYQKRDLEDDARLLGLRDSRRGVPSRTISLAEPVLSHASFSNAMAYTTSTKNTHFAIFPSAPASTNVFALFGHAQSPRDNHIMCEDLRKVFGSTITIQKKESSGSGSFRGLKKILSAI
ncbi:hypothetical protein DFJ58DRAFT_742992 [Suillus subalutaceus]|uniref:uncharacterized protein n=1 Tax=Suillus subalutaceus TaxID=48586 RepID=UPI001B86E2ED|nr:uncharacterized protein DFJ58DRAFT_742992 [Suillus subalutaceus]KAG1866494.1 hypothetical protein DFJ58DRAFT_742992 [Suillus subalutaceus]